MTFAAKTEVSPEKSRVEIERTLTRYGASHFGYASMPGQAVVMFQAHDRSLKFSLPLPGKTHSQTQAQHEQMIRSRWRALALAIKAKLECVESKISTFEEEFLSNIVLPNGQTMGERYIPEIALAYESKKMPPLLGFGG
jgi:hypothetical protein